MKELSNGVKSYCMGNLSSSNNGIFYVDNKMLNLTTNFFQKEGNDEDEPKKFHLEESKDN